MTRRLLGYALLADGVLVALFDGGYVRIWRPGIPNQIVSATKRAQDIHPLLSRLLGITEIGAGLALIALASRSARRKQEAQRPAPHRKAMGRKAA
ncbi:MAG: hypothetical protein M1335_01960 [Chloroflexi bacterium]|nr:hypothetical protein [Chloroflexota bacterium]